MFIGVCSAQYKKASTNLFLILFFYLYTNINKFEWSSNCQTLNYVIIFITVDTFH